MTSSPLRRRRLEEEEEERKAGGREAVKPEMYSFPVLKIFLIAYKYNDNEGFVQQTKKKSECTTKHLIGLGHGDQQELKSTKSLFVTELNFLFPH